MYLVDYFICSDIIGFICHIGEISKHSTKKSTMALKREIVVNDSNFFITCCLWNTKVKHRIKKFIFNLILLIRQMKYQIMLKILGK